MILILGGLIKNINEKKKNFQELLAYKVCSFKFFLSFYIKKKGNAFLENIPISRKPNCTEQLLGKYKLYRFHPLWMHEVILLFYIH